jgi:hypothetical protein
MTLLKIMPIYRKWKWLSVGFLETIISNKLFTILVLVDVMMEEDYINLNQVQNQL